MQARILIVDDEEDITSILKAGLEQAGFEVRTENEPLQVLKDFKPGMYDMVLLDVRMPDIDGFTLYEKMREIDRRIRVCFLTAFDVAYLDLFKEKFPFLPDKCYIKKPVTVRNLVQMIKAELNIVAF
ncbi:MAG: response regulator transcription factor [Nitrososphaera sp.]|uniref:response regulator transcription factor n=1 Tax=Nitrososphaera sp. TaxID=1971748 RepID=UPI003D6FFFD1